MAKALAFCAHATLVSHCHAWRAGEFIPNKYQPSVQLKWDKDLKPTIVQSPCLVFSKITVSFYSTDMSSTGTPLISFHVLGIKISKDYPQNCVMLQYFNWKAPK
jgi:hypothetical protein